MTSLHRTTDSKASERIMGTVQNAKKSGAAALRLFFGIKTPEHVMETVRNARDEERTSEYESNIEAARGDLRQSMQRLESGTRVMRTMEGVIIMARGHSGG